MDQAIRIRIIFLERFDASAGRARVQGQLDYCNAHEEWNKDWERAVYELYRTNQYQFLVFKDVVVRTILYGNRKSSAGGTGGFLDSNHGLENNRGGVLTGTVSGCAHDLMTGLYSSSNSLRNIYQTK